MSQSEKLQRTSSFLCSHYLQYFRLQDAFYLHLKKKVCFIFAGSEKNPRDGIVVEKSGLKAKTTKKD